MTREISNRITVNPEICHGQPCVKGTRIMVSVILDCLANGMDKDEILSEYPGIAVEDIEAAISYAAKLVRTSEEFGIETEAR